MMTFGSLFSGIGGLDLGLERAGMECKFQVEVDKFCRKVLCKHWPNVPKYGDIRELSGEELAPVDLIAGGFPCQDISVAGKGEGITGSRSGLWSEYLRLIRILRPRFVLVENVAALRSRGLGRVLGDLAESGYDAEWSVLSACSLGASHTRERVFVIAYPEGVGRKWRWSDWSNTTVLEHEGFCQEHRRKGTATPKPNGVGYGIPNRVDRLRSVGNAVYPDCAEWIGRQLLRACEEATPKVA